MKGFNFFLGMNHFKNKFVAVVEAEAVFVTENLHETIADTREEPNMSLNVRVRVTLKTRYSQFVVGSRVTRALRSGRA